MTDGRDYLPENGEVQTELPKEGDRLCCGMSEPEVSGLVIWSEETMGTKQTRHKPGLRAWQSVPHLCNVKSNIKTGAF